jgi:3-deoxy-D-manno-octulosonate 8-phosphate phosphatase KdsC-like HAD superfamily phosphatase
LSLPYKSNPGDLSSSEIIQQLKQNIQAIKVAHGLLDKRATLESGMASVGKEDLTRKLQEEVDRVYQRCIAKLGLQQSQPSIPIEFEQVVTLAKINLEGFFKVWATVPSLPGKIRAGSCLPDTKILALSQAAAQLRMAVIDVDGTLIKKTMPPAYDVEDSYALIKLSPKFEQSYGCRIVVLTGNPQPPQLVLDMMAKIPNVIFHSSVSDKVTKTLELFGKLYPSEKELSEREKFSYIGAIGDDRFNEEKLMRKVALSVCPSSARKEMIDICKMVTPHEGGDGAVRDFLQFIAFAKEHSTELIPPPSTTTTSTTFALEIPPN